MDNLLIKSIDRSSGTSSDFKLYSKLVLEGTYLLKHAVIPNTIYNVNETNNRFVLNEGGLDIAITLPVGNWASSGTFEAMVGEALTLAGTYTYTAVIDPNTHKLVLINNSASLFSLDFTQVESRSKQLLGFELDHTGLSYPVMSTGVVNLGSPVSSGIQLDQSTSRNYENVMTDSAGTIYIPFNTSFGSFKSLPSIDLPQYVKFERRERYLRVRVVDTSTNEPLDLNGADFELLLTKA
jgi:hypothetical protein